MDIYPPLSPIFNLPQQINTTTQSNGVILPVGAFLGIVCYRIDSDVTVTNSTTFTDIPNFDFAINPGEKWIAETFLQSGPSLSVTGVKFQITGPSNCTLDYSSDSSGLSSGYQTATAFSSPINHAALGLVGIASAAFRQSFTATSSSGSGNVKVQFAQSGLSLTGLSIRKGSMFTAIRVV